MKTDIPERLSTLAAELRLTSKQRAFAENLATDAERNATRAARAAGCGRGAEVTASKWLRLAKVQTYIQAVTAAAEAELQARTVTSVSALELALRSLTAILRADIGGCLRLGANGAIVVDHQALRRAPAGAFTYRVTKRGWSLQGHQLEAAQALIKYYEWSARRAAASR